MLWGRLPPVRNLTVSAQYDCAVAPSRCAYAAIQPPMAASVPTYMTMRRPVRSTNEFRRARSVDSTRIVNSSDLTGKEGRWESARERDTIASAEASAPNGLEALPPFASVEINGGQAMRPSPRRDSID